MLTNTYKTGGESCPEFVCEKCDYICKQKWMWNRHITTTKHQNTYKNTDIDLHKSAEKLYACKCGNEYSHRQSLYNHRKKCKGSVETDTIQAPVKQTESDIIVQLIKQNQEFKEMLIEQNTKMCETFSEVIKHTNNTTNNNNHINSHNKTFNLNVFLNEDCKDAMNITDFVNSINLQLSDLEHVGEVGYVEGISNIIIKNLKALDVTKRPVHCTDPKRETIYIKDGDVWEKDEDDNKKLRKMIRSVAFRNCKNTRLFKEKYPDCTKYDSKYSDIYNKIIIEVMGGGPKSNDIDNQNKIMRKIAKVMTIDKNNLS
jgi:hypothetical protein